MPQIEGQKDLYLPFNRSGQDMAVAGIGQCQTGNPVLVAPNIGLGQDALHYVARLEQPFACYPAGGGKVADPFLVNRIGPPWANQTVYA